jgi:hypothetical protein
MKKSLRVALVVAVFASVAPFALAAPGGGMPQPQVSGALTVAVAVILSFLGL